MTEREMLEELDKERLIVLLLRERQQTTKYMRESLGIRDEVRLRLREVEHFFNRPIEEQLISLRLKYCNGNHIDFPGLPALDGLLKDIGMDTTADRRVTPVKEDPTFKNKR